MFRGEKGRKTKKTHSESACGWVLIGWALGHSLKSTVTEVPGKSPGKFWGNSGKSRDLPEALGKSDALPTTRPASDTP